jgi:hypothetical protein
MKKHKSILLIIPVFIVLISTVCGLQKKNIKDINTEKFTDDTQLYAPCGDNHLNILWWMPFEYWNATFEKDGSMSKSEKEEALNVFKPYSLLAVCQSDISDFGAFKFYTKDEIKEHLKITLITSDNKSKEIIPLEQISPDMKLFLNIFKPILSAAMGNMGDNLHFFVLSDKDENGKRVIDPYDQGSIKFNIKKRSGESLEAKLELPIDSLYVPRLCPNGKPAHVSWNYCPWTGKKLED